MALRATHLQVAKILDRTPQGAHGKGAGCRWRFANGVIYIHSACHARDCRRNCRSEKERTEIPSWAAM